MKYIYSFLYILTVVASNILASTILFDFGGVAVLTVGTLTFGLVFFLRDLIHRYGKKYVYSIIFVSLLVSIFVNLITNTPMQIVIASALGLIIGEIADTEIFERLRSKSWLTKALTSNILSVPLDSIMFNVIAFIGSELQGQIIQLTIADVLYKLIIAGLLSIGVYRVGERLLTHKKTA
jgi:queuosine precursor transporter